MYKNRTLLDSSIKTIDLQSGKVDGGKIPPSLSKKAQEAARSVSDQFIDGKPGSVQIYPDRFLVWGPSFGGFCGLICRSVPR